MFPDHLEQFPLICLKKMKSFGFLGNTVAKTQFQTILYKALLVALNRHLNGLAICGHSRK